MKKFSTMALTVLCLVVALSTVAFASETVQDGIFTVSDVAYVDYYLGNDIPTYIIGGSVTITLTEDLGGMDIYYWEESYGSWAYVGSYIDCPVGHSYTFNHPGEEVVINIKFFDTDDNWVQSSYFYLDDTYVEESATTFTDVVAGSYYEDAVAWAKENQITTGTGDGTTFSPDATCTRREVVTFLWRVMGCQEPTSSENPFTDVADGQWYTDAILWANEKGITNGTSDTTFDPKGTCTSAQVVTFIYRAMGEPAYTTTSDLADGVSSSYVDAISWADENGLLDDIDFSANEDSPRADIVTYLYRFATGS